MRRNHSTRNYILAGISAAVLVGSLVITKIYGRNVVIISLLAISLMVFGNSMSEIFKQLAIKGTDQKELDIEEKDERNTLIREKAAAKTNYFMLTLLSLMTFILVFMNVELWIICLFASLIGAEAIILVLTNIYYSKKY